MPILLCTSGNWTVIIDVGYWIGGFGLGEGIDERPALLSTIVVSAIAVLVHFIKTLFKLDFI